MKSKALYNWTGEIGGSVIDLSKIVFVDVVGRIKPETNLYTYYVYTTAHHESFIRTAYLKSEKDANKDRDKLLAAWDDYMAEAHGTQSSVNSQDTTKTALDQVEV